MSFGSGCKIFNFEGWFGSKLSYDIGIFLSPRLSGIHVHKINIMKMYAALNFIGWFSIRFIKNIKYKLNELVKIKSSLLKICAKS